MKGVFFLLLKRELALGWGLGASGGRSASTAWLPVAFFLSVAIAFSFAAGADTALLERIGGSIIWVAALLAAILPIDRLIRPDLEKGFFDQWAIREISEELIILAKILAHWLSFTPPLLIAAMIAAAMTGLEAAQIRIVFAGLIIATPALAAMAVTIAALTAGLPQAAALSGLLMLPMAIPMLIFGSGALRPGGENGLYLLAAVALAILALAPFAAGGAIRASRQ